MTGQNADPLEREKFNRLSQDWWNPAGSLSTLHDIQAVRWEWIAQIMPDLAQKQVLDIGCGGGILSESFAKAGANVMGIDIASDVLQVARDHADSQQLSIDYQEISAEDLAATGIQFDIISCMELLEHVPDPIRLIEASASLLKPGGRIFFSTLNRTFWAKSLVIYAAEHLLSLLPRGTHDYARFIKPAELEAACRNAGLWVTDISGFSYLPFRTPKAKLTHDVSINYLLTAIK